MLLKLRICKLVRKMQTLNGFKKQLRNRQGTAQDFSVYIVYNKDVKEKDMASLFYAKTYLLTLKLGNCETPHFQNLVVQYTQCQKQGALEPPVLSEVLSNLAPL